MGEAGGGLSSPSGRTGCWSLAPAPDCAAAALWRHLGPRQDTDPAALEPSPAARGQLRAAAAGERLMLWLPRVLQPRVLHLSLYAPARSGKEPRVSVFVLMAAGAVPDRRQSCFSVPLAKPCETQDDTAAETGRKFPSQLENTLWSLNL